MTSKRPMQHYKNHRRLYPLHHFILLPIAAVYFLWSLADVIHALMGLGNTAATIQQFLGAFLFVAFLFLARTYALKNQNRIIRLEMRQRFFEMTGKSFKEKESQLRLSQIIALRFAGDEELLPLMDRAIKERMKADDIKKAVTDWQEDRHRV